MRIEKVFQIPRAGGQYENIKISAEGETSLECLKEIYVALYMDRIVANLLTGSSSEEIEQMLTRVNAVIQKLTDEYSNP